VAAVLEFLALRQRDLAGGEIGCGALGVADRVAQFAFLLGGEERGVVDLAQIRL